MSACEVTSLHRDMDVDHIPAGVDFLEYLNSQVAVCDVFLAVIGPNWLDAKDDDGRRRFDNPDDFVTIEIAAALARKIRVIPVLVDGARTPKADKLPDSIKTLVRRNAVEVRNTHFGRDAEALANKLLEAFQDSGPVKKRWPFLASTAAWAPGQWRTVALSATVLLLVGWIGLYQMGVPVWVPWAEQLEAKRKAAEAEVQRLNEVVQRQTKAAADADAKLKAEQQRLATVKAEEERKPSSLAGLFTRRANTEAIGFPPVDGKPVSSIGECEQSCTQSATCKIFTFRKSTAMCYTYSDANFVPSDYFDTGIRK
jgi:hypothetical protein